MATNLEFIKSASGTNVSSIDVSDCFSDKYDVYKVVLKNYFQTGTSSRNMQIRFINTSGVQSTSNYDYANLVVKSYATFEEQRATGGTAIPNYFVDVDLQEQGAGAVFYIYNPYNSSSYTFLGSQAVSFNNGNGLDGIKGIGTYKVAETVTGIHFLISSTEQIEEINVSVYGVK